MSFSYKLLSDATAEIYKAMQQSDLAKFEAWKLKGNRATLATDVAFRAWWNANGRTAFKTTEDSLRYKTELRALIDG